jgi:dolichyl-phosphate beta-glucosyltransferase
MHNTPYLSVIIPAYNEEQRLGSTLERITVYLQQQSYTSEVIVVDDGSHDATSAVAKTWKNVRVLTQPSNQGKGAAVRRGMLEAHGTYRLFSDADLSTPIEEIAKLLLPLERGTADVCIGSRALNRENVKKHQPWLRETMGKGFNVLVQMMVLRGITDTQCGFKVLTAECAQTLFSHAHINGFGFDVEMLYLARRHGYRIAEESVLWFNDERTTVHPIIDSFAMLREIVRIRYIHRS